VPKSHSLDQSDRERIPIKLPLAGPNRRDDDEDRIQDPKRDQNRNAYEDDEENESNYIVNQHRDLEIQRFLSVRVDLRRVAAFYQPYDKRT